ncbi:MAG: ABC transporter permease subunit [Pseudomonadota bacterium]|nr:ABC transporter permease subunit [Pseudomonadota bacterium]
MLKYIIGRLLGIIPVLWVLATITFFLVRLAPGSPFDSEKAVSPEILAHLKAKAGFDEPLPMQYLIYMKNLLQGDLGPSFRYTNLSVNEAIATALPVTMQLGLCGLIYAIILGFGLGMFAATKPNTLRDYGSMGFSLLGVCMPSFMIGPLLMLLFAIKLRWFNVSGWETWKDMVLPSLTLGTIFAAYFSRLVRVGFLDILNQDFIKTAKAKGLSARRIFLLHAAKGGVLPAVSFLGPATASILSGSLVVETVFNIPGIGRFFIQSAFNRDYGMIIGTTLVYGVMLILLNVVVDVAYALLNPKVRYD